MFYLCILTKFKAIKLFFPNGLILGTEFAMYNIGVYEEEDGLLDGNKSWKFR